MGGVFVTPGKTSQFDQLREVFRTILTRPQVFKVGRKNNVLAAGSMVESLPDRTRFSGKFEKFSGPELSGVCSGASGGAWGGACSGAWGGACRWLPVVTIRDRAH